MMTRFRFHTLGLFLWLAIIAVFPGSATAQDEPHATLTASLNYTALQPGQQAVIAIVMDVKPGFHAQSHTPLDPNFIALQITPEPNSNIDFLPPIYPPGRVETYPALGKLSVYLNQVILYVPLQVHSNVPTGPIKLGGKVSLQACDDKSCFPPEDLDWSISTQIVGAGQTLQANQPQLFKDFDPTTFATAGGPGSTTQPAASALPGTRVELFGVELGKNSYALAFAGALVVGMLFNVMPCVLPIVPLKAMGFYQAAQEHRARSAALGAFFAAGIVCTFGVLALIVVVYRSAGWGQLFGNPYFAAVIVIILIGLALQTFGAFDVVLPDRIYNVTPKHDTKLGNFLFGILTAILSTPCTFGMFLGLLVWATTQPAVLGTTLVMTVGLGMALPYLVLATFPELARRFPRTGPWAELVKQMMGFLLLATAVYFGRRFLPESLAGETFWWILFGVIALAALYLVVRTIQFSRSPIAIAVSVFIAALIVVPSLLVTLRLTYVPVHWVRFSQSALDDAIKSRKPVIIDFTAAWCGNCQAIEATVFVDKRTVDALEQERVVAFKADLTDRNAPGWQLLRSLHPVGAIPFTAIYLPGESSPKTLAGLYTTDDLLTALRPATAAVSAVQTRPWHRPSVPSAPQTLDASPSLARLQPAR